MKSLILCIWGGSIVITCWLSLSPAPVELPPTGYHDKVAHAITYAWLCFLPYLAQKESRKRLWMLGFAILLGCAIEFLQAFIPNRYPSGLDIIANLLGSGIGIVAGRRLSKTSRQT